MTLPGRTGDMLVERRIELRLHFDSIFRKLSILDFGKDPLPEQGPGPLRVPVAYPTNELRTSVARKCTAATAYLPR